MPVIVIGAGPAGLLAAVGASAAGARVVVLEKNAAAGRKLLLTAGGRCNVSHAGSVDELLEHYGPGQGRFLKRALHAFASADLAALLERHGLGLVEDEGGRLYPATMRADDVRRALLQECRRPAVAIRFGEAAAAIERSGRGLAVATAAHGRRRVAGALAGLAVPARVLVRVLQACAIAEDLRAADLDRRRRRLLAERLLASAVTVERLGGWDEAMVTRGGVRLEEVDPATMESRIVPGLFVAGETLDIDGDTGGYNLQAAFSTGLLAGRSAAARRLPRAPASGKVGPDRSRG